MRSHWLSDAMNVEDALPEVSSSQNRKLLVFFFGDIPVCTQTTPSFSLYLTRGQSSYRFLF